MSRCGELMVRLIVLLCGWFLKLVWSGLCIFLLWILVFFLLFCKVILRGRGLLKMWFVLNFFILVLFWDWVLFMVIVKLWVWKCFWGWLDCFWKLLWSRLKFLCKFFLLGFFLCCLLVLMLLLRLLLKLFLVLFFWEWWMCGVLFDLEVIDFFVENFLLICLIWFINLNVVVIGLFELVL